MKKSQDYYLLTMGIIFSMLASFIVLDSLDRLVTGVGFGRDSRFIVYTENETVLDEFMNVENRQHKELLKKEISDDTYLLTVSGVEQVETYRERIENFDPDLQVLLLGSFGSVTKLKNNESFVSIYFIVLIALFIAYFSYRFSILGYFSSLDLVGNIMLSITLTHFLGYSFSKMLWLIVLLCFISMFFIKQSILMSLEKESISQKVRLSILEKKFISFVFLLIISSFFYLLKDLRFKPVSSFLFFLAWIFFLVSVLEYFVIYPLFLKISKKSNEESIFEMNHRYLFKWYQKPVSNKKVLLILSGLVFLSSIFSLLYFDSEFKKSVDYNNQYVMIFNRSDPHSYLELQAILYREGYQDLQMDYEISEQGNLWLYFKDEMLFKDLVNISEIVGKEMKSSVTYYSTNAQPMPLENPKFYQYSILFLFFSSLYLHVSQEGRNVKSYLFLTVASFVFYIYYVLAFQISWTTELMITLWFMPIIFAFMLNSPYSLEVEDRDKNYLSLMANVFVLLLSFSIPVFIIIPTSLAVELVLLFFILVLSLSTAFSLYLLLDRNWKGRFDDSRSID